MNLIELAVRQPKTIAVGVILALLGGLMAVLKVPVQMTPEVKSVVVSVNTFWENASPEEVESDIIDEQEKVLGNLSRLVSLTSTSRAGAAELRLEFMTGTDIDDAVNRVNQRIGEVPGYPAGVLQPVIEGLDPETRDYIAWVALSSSDPDFDATTLHEFMERRLLPRLERIDGISEVGMMGTREKEIHLIVDPMELARRGISYGELLNVISASNGNYSGGKLPEGKNDIRIRTVGRFKDVDEVKNLVVRREGSGPIYLGDIADVQEGYKEATTWARARGHYMPFFNFTLEHGANLLSTMDTLRTEFDKLNAPGGLLELEAQQRGINGNLQLVVNFDATSYVRDAVDLVRSNILVGGALATLILLLFLRSVRVVGIVAIAIPISVISSIVVMVALGRTVNIISLAGMAFAVGMVVDNAIVVIENIFRHREMGKPIRQAALEGAQEVGGAVLASTLTTLVVFLPILLIQDSAGQLFRDIALAIMAAVGLSLIVSITVIPSAAAAWLGKVKSNEGLSGTGTQRGPLLRVVGGSVSMLMSSWILSTLTIAVFFVGTVFGIVKLMPPLDYLPLGNRNIVFGLLFPPPGYNTEQISELGERIEAKMRPAWEYAGTRFDVERQVLGQPLGESSEMYKPVGPEPDKMTVMPMGPNGPDAEHAREVVPPKLDYYFLVNFNGLLFQGAIAQDHDLNENGELVEIEKRIADVVPFVQNAVSGPNMPDVYGAAFQMPLFQSGGTSGSAIKIDLFGENLGQVEQATGALFGTLMQKYGPQAILPDPMNFSLPTPELRMTPNDERLRELGMTRADVGRAMMANSDGLLLPRQFEAEGDLKDLKILPPTANTDAAIVSLQDLPIAAPDGTIIKLSDVADLQRVTGPEVIKHVNRQRAVTLQLTPPEGESLQSAIDFVNESVANLKAAGAIPPGVEVDLAGSAGKLKDIKDALVGDGTIIGTVTSSLVLAFLVIYLLMVVLFQSWIYPLVILVSVPLATLGGFAALRGVHDWSVIDPYMPVQQMDVLTILGFVILAGVVVNNAILIVHQTLNFLRDGEPSVAAAIQNAVESRVRPILMSTLTSVGGMLPLVLVPGSGSELYRGLGAVVVGGLIVSTVFTLFLVPILLNVVMRISTPAFENGAKS